MKYTGESKRSPYVQQADPIKVTWKGLIVQ